MEGMVAARAARIRARRRRARMKAAAAVVAGLVVCTMVAFVAGCGENNEPSYPESTVGLANTEEIAKQEEPAPSESPEVALPYTEQEVTALCQTVYGEAMITHSDMEMAAVVWCILNRVDSTVYEADTIMEIVTARRQFHGYSPENPVDEHIKWLVLDVLGRWMSEKAGNEDAGRVLPKEYLYFEGDGWHNHFSTEYQGQEKWDWSLPNPYES